MSRSTRLFRQTIAAASIRNTESPLEVSFTAENYPAALPQNLADQSGAFESAAQAVDGGTSDGAGEGAPFGSQPRNLTLWAKQNEKLIPDQHFDSLQVISDRTSEHKVYFRQPDRRAVKKTWAGVYGQIPTPLNGKLDRKNASPAEYLRRMSLQIEVFASDIKLEGVNVSDRPSMIIGQPAGEPSIVISQGWIDKCGLASNEDINAYLLEEGFKEVVGSYFGWFRPQDGVIIVDAKPDNFIKTSAGLVPIDLQMAVFTDAEIEAAGLNYLRDQPAVGSLIILP